MFADDLEDGFLAGDSVEVERSGRSFRGWGFSPYWGWDAQHGCAGGHVGVCKWGLVG